MQSWGYDLTIATLGALFGAAVVYAASAGVKITAESRTKRKQLDEQERAAWHSKDILERLQISNGYLFSILKLFVVGNTLWVLSSLVADVAGKDPAPILDYAADVLEFLGVIFFLWALAEILRFTKLHKSDEAVGQQ